MKGQQSITLYNEDCLLAMNKISNASIDMILCDLPYGITARNKWDVQIPFDKLWEQYERIIKLHGCIALFGSGMFTADLMVSNKKLWRYNLIWRKTTPTGFLNANRMPLRAHEDICIFYKKPPIYHAQKTSGHRRKVSTAAHKKNSKQSSDYREYKPTTYDSTERYPTSVLTFPTDKQHGAYHPTQKPVALLEWIIKAYTDEGDIILDNTMGSGSTGVAAVNTDRRFIGMEVHEEWFSIAKNRIQIAQERRDECSAG